MKVSLCSNVNTESCNKDDMPDMLKKKLSSCNFEGRLANDPDSVVNLAGCRDGTQDVSVISSVESLTNMYRQRPDGQLEEPDNVVYFHDETVDEKHGQDYTLLDDPNFKAKYKHISYSDSQGFTFTMIKEKHCCSPVKIICKKNKKKRKKDLKCKIEKGKPCCGRKKKDCSCKKLKKYILKKKKDGFEPRKKQEEKMKNRINRKKESKTITNRMRGGQTNASQKLLSTLSKNDLQNLLKNMEIQTKGSNPKCKPTPSVKNKFRSAGTVQLGCVNCSNRVKEPIPEKKIYEERTVEFGLFTDRHVYNQMAVSLNISYFFSISCSITGTFKD